MLKRMLDFNTAEKAKTVETQLEQAKKDTTKTNFDSNIVVKKVDPTKK